VVGTSTLSSNDVLALLGTTSSGLGGVEAARRLRVVGPNQLEQVRRRPLSQRFLEQFTSFFAVLLWMGGAIAFLGGMPELAWAIFAVITVNGVFSFIQEYRAERAAHGGLRRALSARDHHDLGRDRGGTGWQCLRVPDRS
jgi:Ca2+-transporting ATPase